MTRDNLLFAIIGLLLGFIIGFMFASTISQRDRQPASATTARNQNLPPDHPALPAEAGKDPQQTFADVQAALKQAKEEPSNFDAQMRAAELYYQIQRYDQAIEFLLKANQLKPDSYEPVVNLGNVNFDAGHFEAAEKWYAAALQKRPDDVNVRTDLGSTFLSRQPPDLDRAIKEFRRSIELDPNHKQTIYNLVVAYLQKDDAREAQEMISKLEGIDPANQDLAKFKDKLAALHSGKK